MSRFLSFSELSRKLNLSYPRARRLLKQGILTPSGRGPNGPVFNAAHIGMWREAIDAKPARMASGDVGEGDCPVSQ